MSLIEEMVGIFSFFGFVVFWMGGSFLMVDDG